MGKLSLLAKVKLKMNFNFEFIDRHGGKKLEVPLVGEVNEDEARIALAAELYREGKMTLKQAADTALQS